MAKYEIDGFVEVGVHAVIEANRKEEAIKKLRDQDWEEIHEGPWGSPINIESIKRNGKLLHLPDPRRR